MFGSGRSEIVTRIVGDINATLVRKLEDLEHRVLMRIENLQRYEETTMGALTARVDALERTASSLRFQNEMIQDELDELERLLLREFAQSEMGATITASCKHLVSHPPRSASPPRARAPSSKNTGNATAFAQKFGKRIFEKENKRKQTLHKLVLAMTRRIANDRADLIAKAAKIAKSCGSPAMLNNKGKLLTALVLHIAACIISEQKKEIQKAKENKDNKTKVSRMGSVLRRVANINTINKAIARHTKSRDRTTQTQARSRQRTRCLSDQGSIYDLNQFAYNSPTIPPKRLYSRPLQPISPEPQFVANVQRRPWSTKAKADDHPMRKQATYRYPAIKRYANCPTKWSSCDHINDNLIDIGN